MDEKAIKIKDDLDVTSLKKTQQKWRFQKAERDINFAHPRQNYGTFLYPGTKVKGMTQRFKKARRDPVIALPTLLTGWQNRQFLLHSCTPPWSPPPPIPHFLLPQLSQMSNHRTPSHRCCPHKCLRFAISKHTERLQRPSILNWIKMDWIELNMSWL